MSEKKSIQPIVILQTGTMSKADMKRMRDCGLCVVESKMPSAVRFLDAPVQYDYSIQERAAIELSRVLLKDGKIGVSNYRTAIAAMYSDILLRGDPLNRVPYVPFLPKG